MSYILDALKKSDKQRQQARVPDLNTVQLELAPPKKKKAPWLLPLGVIVLANVIFILFFVLLHKQPATKTQAIIPGSDQAPQETVQERRQAAAPQATPEPSSVSREPLESEPAAAEDESTSANRPGGVAASGPDPAAAPPMAQEETAAAPPPQEEAYAEDPQAGASDAANTSAPQLTPEPSPASREPLPAEPAAAEDESAAANRAGGVAASRPDPAAAPSIANGEIEEGGQLQEEAQAEDTRESGPEEANMSAPPQEEAITGPVTASHPEEYNEKPEQDQPQRPPLAETADSGPLEPEAGLTKKALHIDQLPVAIRRQLPDFHISAHLFYKDKPAARLACINGKVLREGQMLAPDLKVAEISTDGVIFRYQKYLFYVPVF
ncbi:MAG: general secretion pathway protein GspB [Desulfobulbaceae bacterium]|nr:general secretion pathway protein GspB [Desulfobulbaceae bacterium]